MTTEHKPHSVRGKSVAEKVRDGLSIGGMDACWEWQGTKSLGYGITTYKRKNVYVHRWMYERYREPIPAGMHIDHLCKNRACANPRHIEVVTLVENVMRGESPQARNARKTHCKRGHEFTPENTYTPPGKRGGRYCRECLRLLARRAYWRKREASSPAKEPA